MSMQCEAELIFFPFDTSVKPYLVSEPTFARHPQASLMNDLYDEVNEKFKSTPSTPSPMGEIRTMDGREYIICDLPATGLSPEFLTAIMQWFSQYFVLFDEAEKDTRSEIQPSNCRLVVCRGPSGEGEGQYIYSMTLEMVYKSLVAKGSYVSRFYVRDSSHDRPEEDRPSAVTTVPGDGSDSETVITGSERPQGFSTFETFSGTIIPNSAKLGSAPLSPLPVIHPSLHIETPTMQFIHFPRSGK